MLKKYETKDIKLNTPLRGLPAGHIVKVKCKDGLLLDQYWRRRLKDAAIDGCVEIIENKAESKIKNIAERKEQA
jgi:hypothetical protein